MKSILTILFCLSSSLCQSQNWYPVGNGTNNGNNGGVELFAFNNKLFIGGSFSAVDNKSTSGVAYWNETNWIPFHSTDFRSVRAFATYQGELFAFATYNTVSNETPRLIKYNESLNKWDEVPNSKVKQINGNGSITSGYIITSLEFNNELYVIGDFDLIGDSHVRNIAKWNGSNWSPLLENDSTEVQFNFLKDMIVFNDELVICGRIDNINGEIYNDIAKWNNIKWDNLNGGLIDARQGFATHLSDLEIFNGELYVGGTGSRINDDDIAYLANKWNGFFWEGIKGFEKDESTPNYSRVSTLKRFGNFLVAGISPKGQTLFYNGEDIHKLDEELNHTITNFEIFNKQLYAGGYFHGQDIPNGIARLGSLENIDSIQLICKIFPNPTSGDFLLDFNLNESSGTVVRLYDSAGKKVLYESFKDSKGNHVKNFNISNLTKGVYFVNILSKEFNETKKIILK